MNKYKPIIYHVDRGVDPREIKTIANSAVHDSKNGYTIRLLGTEENNEIKKAVMNSNNEEGMKLHNNIEIYLPFSYQDTNKSSFDNIRNMNIITKTSIELYNNGEYNFIRTYMVNEGYDVDSLCDMYYNDINNELSYETIKLAPRTYLDMIYILNKMTSHSNAMDVHIIGRTPIRGRRNYFNIFKPSIILYNISNTEKNNHKIYDTWR